MVKEYEMTGTCPIIVNGYGRVEPETGTFRCEMEAAQEAFFSKIGAVRIVAELPNAATPGPKALDTIDGEVEFDGRTLKQWPASWPRRPEETP